MKILFRGFAIVLLVVAVAGCKAPSDDAARAPAFELKVYNVPAADSKAIASNLSAVLESSEFLLGTKSHTEMRVTQPFPGTVMVLAPASVQPSIASAIAELQKPRGEGPASGPKAVPLSVQSWIVQAKAGAGDDAAELRPLGKALDRIRSSLGPSHFVLADSATVSIDAPTHRDAAAGIAQVVTERGHKFYFQATDTGSAGVALRLQLSGAGAAAAFRELSTTVSIKPGDYVVLAEAPPATDSTRTPGSTLMNLVVARVDRLVPNSR